MKQKKFEESRKKYKKELEDKEESMEELKDIVIKHKKNVTLIYGVKDEEHNQAVVLKERFRDQC